MLVAACTLTTGTFEVVATVGTVFRCLVGGTVSIGTGTGLLGIAGAGAPTTYRARGGKLTTLATSFVAVITDRSRRETAGGGIAAAITATAIGTPTITVFAIFDDAITALAATDRLDTSVIGQAVAVDGIPAQGAADVAHGTGGELVDPGGGSRVHDEGAISVTTTA